MSPDSSILILSSENELISVSPGGRELWRFPLESAPVLPPAVDSYGTIYLMSDSRTLMCLDRTGRFVWKKTVDISAVNLYALYDRILVIGHDSTTVYYTDGELAGQIKEAPLHLLFLDPYLYWQKPDGSWNLVDMDTLELSPAETVLPPGTLYPEDHILVSYENKIISGRKDWFMEAMEAGEDAYHPYYQSGSNPGRSRSINILPGQSQRLSRFKEKSGSPLLPLLQIDSQFLSQILKTYESVKSFQELIRMESDYDLVFQEILSDSYVVSSDVYRESLDEYSRYRIYNILCRWGNLKSRETLLFLSEQEQSPQNIALIMDGLGRIGLDVDGRSMVCLQKSADRFPRDSNVLLGAVRNASLLARYNGGRAILKMMNFYTELQQKNPNGSLMMLIRTELKSF
ncbi:MAG: hypothetical protein PF479_07385 [Oceanispirochaeta sp.]|nr:hypothetical protein [Oceanispirochaeta sp.]